jgi:hypothetical protein
VVGHGLPQRGEPGPDMAGPGRRAVRNFLTPSSARQRPMCDREPIWEPDAIHLRAPIRTHSDAVRAGPLRPITCRTTLDVWSRTTDQKVGPRQNVACPPAGAGRLSLYVCKVIMSSEAVPIG